MKIIIPLLLLFGLNYTVLAQTPKKAETITVNDKSLYYEVYGEGPPLIFLHGYSLSSKSWHAYVADFMDEFELYLIDLTGHGRSEAFKEDLSFPGVAEDLHALLNYLGLKEIRAVGFSFGGDILYQLALRFPAYIKSMITIGAIGSWDIDQFRSYLDVFTYENRADFPWLETSHHSLEQIQKIMSQFKNYKVFLSNEEYQQITTEVLIMMGDDDEGMKIEDVARVRNNLPNSDLWILPDVSHGAHEGDTKEEFLKKAKEFFRKPGTTKPID